MNRCPAIVSIAILLAGCGRSEGPSPPVAGTDGALFRDVTESSGLAGFRNLTGESGEFWFPETMGGGVGVLDYDRDGLLDVVAVTGGRWDGEGLPPIRVYRNQGDLRFTEVTDDVGIAADNVYGMGVTVGDVDGNGWEDIFLTTIGTNVLYVNNGGVFEQATARAGLAGEDVWSTAAAFFDGDGDGDLDLVVGNYVRWDVASDLWCSNDGTDKTYCTPALYEGVSPSYFRNDGTGAFTNASVASGLADGGGKTLGVVTLDYNGDGRTDVAFANDTRADELFLAQGDGTFADVGLTTGFAYDEQGRARAGMGVDAGRDADGLWLLAVGNFADEMIGVYRDVGRGTLVDRSAAFGVGMPSLRTLTFGLLFSDVDLDGDDDLIAVNGHIQPEIGRIRDNVTYPQNAHLFLREGDGFVDRPERVIGIRPIVGRGLAEGDLDGDGDAEMILTENGGGLLLWENLSAHGGSRFIRLDLSRGRAPSSAIGARVDVHTSAGTLVREVRGGRSYLSASSYQLVIGLGSGATVDSVTVSWPDGARAAVRSPPLGETIRPDPDAG